MKKIFLVLALSLTAYAEVNTLNYMEQGGSSWVVGGQIDVTGSLELSGSKVLGTGAELNQLSGTGADYAQMVKISALAASDTAGGVLSFANPYSLYPIRITRFDLDIATGSTDNNATVDCGVAAAAGTSDVLLDGVNVSGARYFSSVYNDTNGVNGSLQARVLPGQYVTCSKAAGATAGLAGAAYIYYHRAN